MVGKTSWMSERVGKTLGMSRDGWKDVIAELRGLERLQG
jgi:hypothetical protein